MRRTRTGGQGTARAESITVNAAGLVQGIALVTFPAASAIFTARSGIPGRRGCARWPHAISPASRFQPAGSLPRAHLSAVHSPRLAKTPDLRITCHRCRVPSRAVITDWIVTRYISCR